LIRTIRKFSIKYRRNVAENEVMDRVI